MKAFVKRLRADRISSEEVMRCKGWKAGRAFAENHATWYSLEQLAEVLPHVDELTRRPGFLQTLFERTADPAGILMTALDWHGFWTNYAGTPTPPDLFIRFFWLAAVSVRDEALRQMRPPR
jgi:hypothetical protein